MRVIQRGRSEAKVNCPYCGSLLGVVKTDIKFSRDISGVSVPYAKCPVCEKYIDLEGNKEISKIL